MQTSKEHLLDWLRDAHAMEQQALQMLKGEEGRLESYPELLEKIRENQRVAQQNRDSLKTCIERLGGDSSKIKDLGAQVMGMAQAISGVVFSDEVMKAVLGLYSTQRLAIASYRILAEAARQVGDSQIQSVCEGILEKELALNDWLDGYLPTLTTRFLTRSDSGLQAKH